MLSLSRKASPNRIESVEESGDDLCDVDMSEDKLRSCEADIRKSYSHKIMNDRPCTLPSTAAAKVISDPRMHDQIGPGEIQGPERTLTSWE